MTQRPLRAWPWPLRPYQAEAYDAFQSGRRRQLLIWHRRAGKDIYGMSLARAESIDRVGAYVHFFPYHVQAKRAIWRGIDPRSGIKFIDQAFGDLVVKTDNTEMLLELENGATWQMLGSDNYDRVVGSNIVGVVFSEWALCDPRAWDYIRPILRENHGWCVFITTYRGRNHAWKMVQTLADNPDWYVSVRTIEDTVDNDGNPIITEADIEAERREGMSDALIRQEYYCDPDAAIDGAVYAQQLQRLRDDPTRLVASWDPRDPVYCARDWSRWPACASVVWLHLHPSPRVLRSETWDFKTVGECVAASRAVPWPSHHLVAESAKGMLEALAGFHIYPEIIPAPAPGQPEFATQSLLDRASIQEADNLRLIDSLMGYVRRDRASETDGALMFSTEYEYSWHAFLVHALELAAVWDQLRGASWARAPDYRVYDHRRI